MERKYPNLCKPITLGRTTFRNRMFSAPMGGTDITNDGCIGPKSVGFYELRSKGGAAAVTVSECMVHPSDGSHAYRLNESILNSLAGAAYCADAIRRHGGIPSLELSHSGMFAGTYMTDKSKQKSLCQWSASACTRPDGVEVKAMDKAMIDEIVAAYGHTAALAKRAGFEMVMVHGGHGWLINQFLSPLFNHRQDEYGGSLENRCRLAIEILKAIREAVGPFFPIEFRMSGAEFCEGGYDLDEGIRIAQMVEPYCDMIHVSAGTYQKTFGITHPSMFTEHGRNVYLAAEIKKHVSKPVATIGGLNDPAQMEEIIASGKADVCYMGRALLADPFLPNKVMANRDEDIIRCLRCFTCMAERAATSTRRCTVNPLIGRECEGDVIYPAPEKKKVLIAGGGPGGLYAAYTAARRGHQVILCEKEAELGGILRFAKYKGPEIGRIEAHDERTKAEYASNPDVDTSRSRLNFHLVKPRRSYRAEAEKQISEAGCRARKDSVRVVETLITASPEFFANKKPREVKEFFEYALAFIQSKQAPETIISAVVHMDEKTPHMHLCFVPLTEDKRLSAKDIIGNKKKLTQWQDEFWKHMVKKYPDFERGESASETGRTHIPPRLFKEAVRLNHQKDKITRLLSEITPLNTKKKSTEIEAILTDYIPSVEKLMTRMKKAGSTVKELKKEIAALEQELDGSKASVQRQLELARKLQEFEALRQTVQELKDEIASIPPEIREKYNAKTERKETIALE